MINNISFTGLFFNQTKKIQKQTTESEDRKVLEDWNKKLNDPKLVKSASLDNFNHDRTDNLTIKMGPNSDEFFIICHPDLKGVGIFNQTQNTAHFMSSDISPESMVEDSCKELLNNVCSKFMKLKDTILEENKFVKIANLIPIKRILGGNDSVAAKNTEPAKDFIPLKTYLTNKK